MLLVRLGDNRAFTSMRALAEQLARDGKWRELAQLMLYARYHADTRTALRVAERITLHRSGAPLSYPRLLLKTLYPTPYSDLVMTEAKARDIDPLVMYALMRQESQFVPNARSHADARGLTQVIPSTGLGIAEQLGETSYDVEDLYLPHVSLRYGTYYLASNMPQFDRKLIPTLAAYNGGPGNAARWLDGSALRDPDLYLERVDIFETEEYLRIVYANYGFYRAAYQP
jgi:soluble lytic murein transglycosylase